MTAVSGLYHIAVVSCPGVGVVVTQPLSAGRARRSDGLDHGLLRQGFVSCVPKGRVHCT